MLRKKIKNDKIDFIFVIKKQDPFPSLTEIGFTTICRLLDVRYCNAIEACVRYLNDLKL